MKAIFIFEGKLDESHQGELSKAVDVLAKDFGLESYLDDVLEDSKDGEQKDKDTKIVSQKTPEEGILINDLKSEIRDIIRNGSYDHWSDICDAVLVPDDDEIRERFYQQILGCENLRESSSKGGV